MASPGEVTVLPSAARTTTQHSADMSSAPENISSSRNNGMHLIINITAFSATPIITPIIEGKDPASGIYYPIATGAAIAVVGASTVVLKVLPGAVPIDNLTWDDRVPPTWRFSMTHADADSVTYSVGAVLF